MTSWSLHWLPDSFAMTSLQELIAPGKETLAACNSCRAQLLHFGDARCSVSRTHYDRYDGFFFFSSVISLANDHARVGLTHTLWQHWDYPADLWSINDVKTITLVWFSQPVWGRISIPCQGLKYQPEPECQLEPSPKPKEKMWKLTQTRQEFVKIWLDVSPSASIQCAISYLI